jgi:hypothetical protein
LVEWNQATIGKLLWNLQSKADKLWVKWIDAYYLKAQDIMTWQGPQSFSWILKRISNCREIVAQTQYWDEANTKRNR